MHFLPCPHCETEHEPQSGIELEFNSYAIGTPKWIVCCRSCGMGGPKAYASSEALAKWNELPRREKNNG